MDTAGRNTVRLVDVGTVHALGIAAEAPVPRVCRRVLRRRPEVGGFSEMVEIAREGPVAARKGSESTGVGCPGIW